MKRNFQLQEVTYFLSLPDGDTVGKSLPIDDMSDCCSDAFEVESKL